jgi:hypothetical protein
MKDFKYKSRFSLPLPESDFVCSLALVLGCSPDEALCSLIRLFAKDNHEFALEIWSRALRDGRGPWK